MFTTRHYVAIAEVIASHQTDPNHCPACEDKHGTMQLVTHDLATMFQADNPRFNRDTFYAAAGFGGK
jgi:hypothetical protein